MGTPAEMSHFDKTLTRDLAAAIVHGVTHDDGTPMEVLTQVARVQQIPIDTLLLWLAQVVMEKR